MMDLPDFDLSYDWLTTDQPDLETAHQLEQPKLHRHRTAKREFVNGLKKQALTELIPTLPAPDVDLYVIGNGAGAEIRHGISPTAFDFGTFIPHIVQMLGDRQCTAYISTWTANAQHVKTMLSMLDDGRLEALTVITDPYFKRREAAVCNELITGLERHAPKGRFLAFKNHVKVICIRNADETQFCTISGSANLSAQPRCEQYILTTAPDVYRFFVDEFFEAMLSQVNHA